MYFSPNSINFIDDEENYEEVDGRVVKTHKTPEYMGPGGFEKLTRKKMEFNVVVYNKKLDEEVRVSVTPMYSRLSLGEVTEVKPLRRKRIDLSDMPPLVFEEDANIEVIEGKWLEKPDYVDYNDSDTRRVDKTGRLLFNDVNKVALGSKATVFPSARKDFRSIVKSLYEKGIEKRANEKKEESEMWDYSELPDLVCGSEEIEEETKSPEIEFEQRIANIAKKEVRKVLDLFKGTFGKSESELNREREMRRKEGEMGDNEITTALLELEADIRSLASINPHKKKVVDREPENVPSKAAEDNKERTTPQKKDKVLSEKKMETLNVTTPLKKSDPHKKEYAQQKDEKGKSAQDKNAEMPKGDQLAKKESTPQKDTKDKAYQEKKVETAPKKEEPKKEEPKKKEPVQQNDIKVKASQEKKVETTSKKEEPKKKEPVQQNDTKGKASQEKKVETAPKKEEPKKKEPVQQKDTKDKASTQQNDTKDKSSQEKKVETTPKKEESKKKEPVQQNDTKDKSSQEKKVETTSKKEESKKKEPVQQNDTKDKALLGKKPESQKTAPSTQSKRKELESPSVTPQLKDAKAQHPEKKKELAKEVKFMPIATNHEHMKRCGSHECRQSWINEEKEDCVVLTCTCKCRIILHVKCSKENDAVKLIEDPNYDKKAGIPCPTPSCIGKIMRIDYLYSKTSKIGSKTIVFIKPKPKQQPKPKDKAKKASPRQQGPKVIDKKPRAKEEAEKKKVDDVGKDAEKKSLDQQKAEIPEKKDEMKEQKPLPAQDISKDTEKKKVPQEEAKKITALKTNPTGKKTETEQAPVPTTKEDSKKKKDNDEITIRKKAEIVGIEEVHSNDEVIIQIQPKGSQPFGGGISADAAGTAYKKTNKKDRSSKRQKNVQQTPQSVEQDNSSSTIKETAKQPVVNDWVKPDVIQKIKGLVPASGKSETACANSSPKAKEVVVPGKKLKIERMRDLQESKRNRQEEEKVKRESAPPVLETPFLPLVNHRIDIFVGKALLCSVDLNETPSRITSDFVYVSQFEHDLFV